MAIFDLLKSAKIDFTINQSGRKILKFPHHVLPNIFLTEFSERDLKYAELASFFFLLQIHFGDLNLPDKTSSSSSGISSGGSSVGAQKQSASEALEKFFPPRYMEPEAAATGDTSVLESTLVEKWASLRGKSVHDCVRIYLTCTRKWQFFGAQLFEVQVS